MQGSEVEGSSQGGLGAGVNDERNRIRVIVDLVSTQDRRIVGVSDSEDIVGARVQGRVYGVERRESCIVKGR